MPISAVLFDFGGTLVDTPPQYDYEDSVIQLQQSLRKNGIAVSFEDYKKAHIEIRDRIYGGNSLREISFGSRICEALSRFGYSFEPTDSVVTNATEAFMEPWIQARTMKKGVPSILRRLKSRHKLGIVSNFSDSSTVWKTLRRFNIEGFFDAVVVSIDVGWRKPCPRIFQTALKTLRVPASESLFVGDELDHDIEGANKVGMPTVWLKKASTQRSKLRVKPDKTIHKLRELPTAIRALEASGRVQNSLSERHTQ